MITKLSILIILFTGIILFSGCLNQRPVTISNKTAEREYNPIINPADFVAKIDNKYYSLIPGTTFIYQGKKEDKIEINNLKVTNQTKRILSVEATVVNDRVLDENNNLIEETFDWYAQDKNGNVWYFGEDAKEYENGKVISTEGSWEAGKDGAKPGIIMKSNPKVGESWRQEYYKGVAEDQAEILRINESVSIP